MKPDPNRNWTSEGHSISSSGLSDRLTVFEPGLEINGETVSRTFQPSFTVTAEGTLLCFCQGRLGDGWDDDMKVVLVNRSFDHGQTWEGARAICSPMNHFAVSSFATREDEVEVLSVLTCVDLHLTRRYHGNDPKRMQDQTGLDLETLGPEAAAVLCRFVSVDQGITWRMEMLTGSRSPLGRTFAGGHLVFLNAIGQVQKMESGTHRGRLFMAAPIYAAPEGVKITPHFRNHPCIGSGVLFSDDRGGSWQMNDFIADYLANECSAVSIENDRELLMVRRLNPENMIQKIPPRTDFRPDFGHRIFQTSTDWGKSWSDYRTRPVSGVPCHGTLSRVDDRIYFSIPQGYGPDVELAWDNCREQGTVYFSDDEGATWRHRVIEPETFAYSTIGKLTDQYRICFYSQGGLGEGGVACRVFTDAWLDQSRH